jgi:hypothetical protein
LRRPAALALPLILALALLALPTAAGATGMALRWNSCKGESNRTFACDRSGASDVLVGSFAAPADIPLSGVEVNLRITANDGKIPAWWMFGAGRCRATSLSASFDVSAETECDDPWQGQAAGGIAYYDTKTQGDVPWQSQAPGAYLRLVMAVPPAAIQTISGGRQYAAFRLLISRTGLSACEGCAAPACIWIDHMKLTTPGERPDETQPLRNTDVLLTTPLTGMGGAGNTVMWQGGTSTCGAGAAKPSTWSELKRRFK